MHENMVFPTPSHQHTAFGSSVLLEELIHFKSSGIVSPPYPQFYFLWFQLPVAIHSLETKDRPSDRSSGQVVT